jgi:C-terminal processing protease CtpA/Prc
VDIEEGGVNGLVVRSLTRGGTLARDGRIQPGDYLVNVNGENLRSVSQAAALAVLRRTQLVPQGELSTEHLQGMISIKGSQHLSISVKTSTVHLLRTHNTCTNTGLVPGYRIF